MGQQINYWGYFCTTLTKTKNSRKSPKVHQLIARAFLGPKPSGMEINHIDGDRTNNSASNLEYCSHKENMAHARKLGLWDPVAMRRMQL